MSLAALALTLAPGGCGSQSGVSSDPPGGGGAGGSTVTGPIQVTSGPYEPLAVGASWTYHVNANGVLYDKVTTVQDTEDAGGPDAGITVFHEQDVFPAQTQQTWYQVDGQVVKRLHDSAQDASGTTTADDWYDPFRLRVDETPAHLVVGATWSLSFTDSQTAPNKPASAQMKTDEWRVDGVDEPVAVPAGNFASLHVTRIDPVEGSTKSFWFVRGIGKVQEKSSDGHTEEMASYQQPAAAQ